MSISDEQKKQISLEGFEVIKDDFKVDDDNSVVIWDLSEEIANIICNMSLLDLDIAAEMWAYYVTKNLKYIDVVEYGSAPANLTYFFESTVLEIIGVEMLFKVIFSNNIIGEIIFGKSPSINYPVCSIIVYCLENKLFYEANQVFSWINNNNNLIDNPDYYTISKVYSKTIESLRDIEILETSDKDEIINFLLEQAKQVLDSKEKARAKAAVVSLM